MNIQEIIEALRFKGDSEIHQAGVNLTMEGKTEAYKKGIGEGLKMAADILEKWVNQEKMLK